MPLKKTPLYDMHLKYGGKLVDFAGFELPISYKGIKEEHNNVRERVGIFDVSHMGEIMIRGRDAKVFVNTLITNDVNNLIDGQILYSPMCDDDGGIVDDILVYRIHEESYMLVVNGGNIDKDFLHISSHLNEYDIEIRNESDSIAQIAIQGPNAKNVLEDLTEINLLDISYYYFIEHVDLGGIDCLLSRTGYTGEDGFEIYIKNENAVRVWELLMEKGVDYEIMPCGLGCRDTLRFEAGMPLYGNELTTEINPFEAGLGFFVKLNKEYFIGKGALEACKVEENGRRLVGFMLLEKGIPRHGYRVESLSGKGIGLVTTGYLSPTLGKPLGFALIIDEGQQIGDEIIVCIRNKKVKGKIVNKRFLKKS